MAFNRTWLKYFTAHNYRREG